MNTDDLTAAAVARLRDMAGGDCADPADEQAARLVLSALEAAQQDARRYRWLRDHAPQKWAPWADERGDTTAGEIDAAIDTAQARQTSGSTDGRAQSDHGEPEVAGPLGAATVGITHPATGKGRGPSLAGIESGPLDHQNGVQRHEASAGCALGASSLESGNAREATCLSGEHGARRRSPIQQEQLGTIAGSNPAAPTDPIADVIAGCRDRARQATTLKEEREWSDVADALERLARERDDIRTVLQNTNRDAARLANIADKYKWQVRDTCTRAERAEAERDALREVVRAADAMADAYYPDPFHHAPPLTVDAYNAARAKVNTTEGEK